MSLIKRGLIAAAVLTAAGMSAGPAASAQILPPIGGLQGAGADDGFATASVLELDGLATVGESSAESVDGAGDAGVTVVEVLDIDLVHRNADGSNGGELEAIADLVDQVNGGTCGSDACIAVLASTAETGDGTGAAGFAVAFVRLGSDGIAVGTSSAYADPCETDATAKLLQAQGALEMLAELNPGGPDHNEVEGSGDVSCH